MALRNARTDDLAAFVSLGRADRQAILSQLSNAERATLKRQLARMRKPSSSIAEAAVKLTMFSPPLRRTLRRALADSAQRRGITPATQRTLQALLTQMPSVRDEAA